VFRFDDGLNVYLHREPVDFRVGINGLAVRVEQALALNPMSAALFVFGNRRRDRVKILGWDGNGFWLMFKRIEGRDRFVWPQQAAIITLSVEQLHWLLEGIDIAVIRKHATQYFSRVS
jgi:transposase